MEGVKQASTRLCVSCKEEFPREDLIRILKEHKTSEWIVSPSRYQFGRSIYLCKTQNCLNKLQKDKRYKCHSMEKLEFMISPATACR